MEYAIEKIFDQKLINTFDFSYKVFKNCSFFDCTIINKNFTNSIFQNCHFSHSKIVDCNFQYAVFENSGKWNDSTFEDNNFSKSVIGNLKIEKTTFFNNYFNRTTFDGTELEKVIFDGKITSSWFYGIPLGEKLNSFDLFFIKKSKPLRTPSIDFQNAELSDVTFSRGLNLSYTKFPNQSHLEVISNPSEFFKKFLKKSEEIFSDPESRSFCKELIDDVLFKPSDRSMPIILIDFNALNSIHNNSRSRRIIELLRGCF